MDKTIESQVKAEIKMAANGENGIFQVELYGDTYQGKVYANGSRVTDLQELKTPKGIEVVEVEDIDDSGNYKISYAVSKNGKVVSHKFSSMEEAREEAEAIKEDDAMTDPNIKVEVAKHEAIKESVSKAVKDNDSIDAMTDPDNELRVIIKCDCCGETFSQSKFNAYRSKCQSCLREDRLLGDKHQEVLDHLKTEGADTVMNMAEIFDRHPSSISGTTTFLMKQGLVVGHGQGTWAFAGKGDTWS